MLQAIGGAAIGAAGMVTALELVTWPRMDLPIAWWLVTVLALPLVFLLIVACHEGGHLVAGALAHFRPCLFIVGPLKLERTGGGWRAGLNRVFPLSGGLVAATPRGTQRLRQRMTLLVAGGPSMSVLAGSAALLVLSAVGDNETVTLSGAPAMLFVLTFAFGIGSLAVGLLALVPGQGHGFTTDGARILRLLGNGPRVDAEVALLGLVGASMSGDRPRDWDATLVARSLQLPADTPYGAAARLVAHNHALDRGDEALAREHLRTALQHAGALPLMSRPSLLLQAAYFAAAHDRDPAAARRHLADAAQGALVSPHSRSLAEGAILKAEGNPRAGEILAAAERELPHAIDRGAALLAADLIARSRNDG
jgi:hypothetical protein